MTMNSRPRKRLLLAEIDAGELVMVCGGPASTSGRVRTSRFRPGEVLHCMERSERDTIVARPDGTRLRIGRVLGVKVEVRRIEHKRRGKTHREAES